VILHKWRKVSTRRFTVIRSLLRFRSWFGARTVPETYRCQPRLEALEDRLTPAWNLSISTAATSGPAIVDINVDGINGIVTYTAIGSGANVNVADIQTDLQNDFDVIIRNDNTGAEAGNINWNALANLDTVGISSQRSLTLSTEASALTGDIVINSSIFNSNPFATQHQLRLTLTAGNGTGAISTANDLNVNEFSATTTTGTISVDNSIDTDDDIVLTAATINLDGELDTDDGGNITLTGNVVLTGDVQLDTTSSAYYVGDGDVTVTGTIEGTIGEALSINAGFGGTVSFGGVIGGGGQITDLDIIAGSTTLGGNLTITNALDDLLIQSNCDAGAFTVSTDGGVSLSAFLFSGTVYSGSGVINATLVTATAMIAITGDGTLNINSDVAINRGLRIDLGATPDQLIVVGAVTINDEARIEGTGSLTAVGPFAILTATGLTGTFEGTAGGVPFILGQEAVTATYTPTTMSIQRAAAGPNTVQGVDPDTGTLYTIRLTGGGGAELVVADNPSFSGIDGIVVRNSTVNHTLTITVNANGSAPTESLAFLRVDGSLGLFSAPAVDLDGDHIVSGYLKSATIRDLEGTLTTGGTATQKTTLKGRDFNVDLTLGSKLNVLTGNDFDGSITAPTIGTITTTAANGLGGDFLADLTLNGGSATAMALAAVNVAGNLSGDWDINGKVGSVIVKRSAFFWDVGTGVGSLGGINKIVVTGGVGVSAIDSIGRLAAITAGRWTDTNVTAASIGTIKLVSNASLGVSGNWSVSDLTVTSFVNPGRVALKSFSAMGTVSNSTFDIQAGNVTSFVVGKFLSSKLYIGLSAGGSLTTGTFGGNNFKLGTFKTTAVPFDPPNVDSPTAAFDDSEVCAARFGAVRLSSVETDFGDVFGLRVATAAGAGSVRIATLPFNPLVNLPTGTVQGDFEFIASA
jgi:hypothetical protein